MTNQTPEQRARDLIDKLLKSAGWTVTDKDKLNWNASLGIAVREYPTDVGPADYVLFVDRKPVGVIEAKREEEAHRLTVVEEQSGGYAGSKLKWISQKDNLPFVYESTGEVTRFTNQRDPRPRSRQIFAFHKPETLLKWSKQPKSLRSRLQDLPELPLHNLRACQIRAIHNLEQSFKENRPRALIQMATGSGKTYTAITSIYRLLKYAGARRVLFLVDTRNLGEQAEQEFMTYTPSDDNRKFTELYNVQRLRSSYISKDSQVCISTIQRLYSILKGEELDEAAEEDNPNEGWKPKEPVPVAYNADVPIEFFDFIVIDECHRSIYNLWTQVLDYFDAFLIGLTATPDSRTYAFFHANVVSEYSHENAVADGVNVGYDVFLIETEITQRGGTIAGKQYVEKREKLTRKKRWEQLDEDVQYSSKQLDKDVVNPNQIRKIIKAFRGQLPQIFRGRKEVPKTLIFAKTDSHADDIIQIVREEFAQGNEFCKKVTYNSQEDPKSVLAQFRNDYNPRIAVTVDMIATGTDVRPLECLLFMRDVKSKNYFEQMKGRGTRTLDYDGLKKVTPSATSNKTHFVVVDAIGVTKSLKTDSRPLEKKPGVPLKNLLQAVLMGAGQNEEVMTSLANRLARLGKQITHEEHEQFSELAGGDSVSEVVHKLLDAWDPDKAQELAAKPESEGGTGGDVDKARKQLVHDAASVFNGPLNTFIENVHKLHEQYIDYQPDTLTYAGWDGQAKDQVEKIVKDFEGYLREHKDEIAALQVFYDQPYRLRELTFTMLKGVLEKLKQDKPDLAPLRVWQAYEQVQNVNGKHPKKELIALVSLIRHAAGIDEHLTPYDATVNRNFQTWVMDRHKGNAPKFNEEQMAWLRMIKDHIASSAHFDADDLNYAPFDSQGGIGRMYQLFGDDMEGIINEMNGALVA